MKKPNSFAAAILLAFNTFLVFVALPVLFFSQDGHAQAPATVTTRTVLVAPIGGVAPPRTGPHDVGPRLQGALIDELRARGLGQVIPAARTVGQLEAGLYDPKIEDSLRVASRMGATHLLQVRVVDYLRLDGGMTAVNLSVQLRDVRESGRLVYKGKSLRALEDGRIDAAIEAEAATIVGRAFAPGARFQPAYDPEGVGQTLDTQPPPRPTTQPEMAYNGTGEPGDSIPDRRDTRHQAGIRDPKVGTIRRPTGTDRPTRVAGDVRPAPQEPVDAPPAAAQPTLPAPTPAPTPVPSRAPTRVASLPPARPVPVIAPRVEVPVPAPAPRVQEDMVPVGTFYFATGSASLDERNAQGASQLAQALADRGDFPVQVLGHADHRGSEGRNLRLSQRRAEAVRDALVASGLSPRGRYDLEGVSDDVPVAQGSDPMAYARNRRAEVLVPRRVLEGAADIPTADAHASPGLRRLRAILGRIRGERSEEPPALAALGPRDSGAYVDPAGQPLQPGNTVHVRVQGRDELTRKVRLGPDGAIRFPLVDRVHLAGQRIGQAEATMKDALGKFIRQPEVELRRVFRIQVFGLVKTQGFQEYDYAPSLSEVLARAEGMSFDREVLNTSSVQLGHLEARVIRGDDIQTVDLTRYLRTGQGLDDVYLTDDDQVVVDHKRTGAVTLLGTVETTVVYRPGLKLLEAIALAGGIDDEEKQNIKNVRVLRHLEDGKVQRLEVNLHDIIHRGQVNRDIELMPGDYVVVPRRRRRLTVFGAFRELLQAFVPAGILKQQF